MVTYQLKPEVNLTDLEEVHKQVNQFLLKQDGFMYRSLSQDEKGVLFDIVYWRDLASAKQAGEAFMASLAGQALLALTNMESVVMRHMNAITEAMTCSESESA